MQAAPGGHAVPETRHQEEPQTRKPPQQRARPESRTPACHGARLSQPAYPLANPGVNDASSEVMAQCPAGHMPRRAQRFCPTELGIKSPTFVPRHRKQCRQIDRFTNIRSTFTSNLERCRQMVQFIPADRVSLMGSYDVGCCVNVFSYTERVLNPEHV